ncbi:preprotein translocase subunit TatC [Paenibacillus beijingensis]|uniref:Sec-independent protein translocase protein TatC n=2 Tax=Paenibacillus beijingensis TaxID=1126833 RepID=A0A0D5NQM5_9BACL|nr:preprotein translocase subunit TatC [Paenibacillus beijingensis]
MPLFEHLGELRKRIIAVLVVLALGLVAGLICADPVYRYLMEQPPVNEMALHAFSLWDGIGIYMKFAFVIALIPVVPFAFYQLWSFVKPALKPQEQRAALRYVPYAVVMFLIGLSFSYFIVLPMAFSFTTKVSRHLGLEETYGITQYFTFMFNIIIPISLLFELPLLIMFLTMLRIVTPATLRKMRRVAYFIMIVIGVTITPPDVVSDILVSIPLVVLYEVSVFLSARIYRRQQRADARFEEDYGVQRI